MTFANAFKYYRKNAHFTQEEVANKLMVTPQAVSKWENGGGTPDISLLVPIAELFGITTDALLGNARKSKQELQDEIGVIERFWNENISRSENFEEKYSRYLALLKNNPDSAELLNAVLSLICTWLASHKHEMSNAKKQELVVGAERFAQKLLSVTSDIHSVHCLLYEIYFHGGETEKAERETAYFSASGRYTKARASYMHHIMQKEYAAALPDIKQSMKQAMHWLFWDMDALAGTYLRTEQREQMYDTYRTMHDLLCTLDCRDGNYALYRLQSTMRLAQNAAVTGETEQCFGYLNEALQFVRHANVDRSVAANCLSWHAFDTVRDSEPFMAIYKELCA